MCKALCTPVWLLFEWGHSPKTRPQLRIVLKFENWLTQQYWNSLIFAFILKAINPDKWTLRWSIQASMAPFPCHSCWEWITFGRSEDICHSSEHSQTALEVGVEMGWTSSSIIGGSASKHCAPVSLPTFELEAANCHFMDIIRWSSVPQSDSFLWIFIKNL